MDDTETILWLSRALASSKKNEARLAGEVQKGNAIIAELERQLADLRKTRDAE